MKKEPIVAKEKNNWKKPTVKTVDAEKLKEQINISACSLYDPWESCWGGKFFR